MRERTFLIVDDAFVQPRQRGDNLDGGARLISALIGQLLVDDGENAPGVGIGNNDRAILRSQGLHRRAASHQILAIHQIPYRGVHRGAAAIRFLDRCTPISLGAVVADTFTAFTVL